MITKDLPPKNGAKVFVIMGFDGSEARYRQNYP